MQINGDANYMTHEQTPFAERDCEMQMKAAE